MIENPMEVSDFKAMTDAIAKSAQTDVVPRLTLIGYEVEDVELVLACAGDEGVVLSVGDTRVSLTLSQLNVLKVLLEAFDQGEKT
jgi:hypothetical protein